MNLIKYFGLVSTLFFSSQTFAQPPAILKNDNPTMNQLSGRIAFDNKIKTGADQTEKYINQLQNKNVALLVNQTSIIKDQLLPDVLIAKGIKLKTIFTPEHGFRGNADAGASVANSIDEKTKLPIISLYGANKKPTAEQLKGIDIVVYDLQDVGVRFYTYISSLQYMMEACAENNVALLILDRPNPIGWMVDGPVLKPAFKSFVGMQPIPVAYGMTPGEYAKMLVGEKWIKAPNLKMNIITCEGYNHESYYKLPVNPSPNLQDMTSIYLYPSLCLFEGTPISVGRGTANPFKQYGNPLLSKGFTYYFTPKSVEGAKAPPYLNEKCFGEFLGNYPDDAFKLTDKKMSIKWLITAYNNYPDKSKFFNKFFNNLAGTDQLRKQIEAGKTEAQIKESWKADLDKFKIIRKKYLLYPETK